MTQTNVLLGLRLRGIRILSPGSLLLNEM